MNKVILQIWEEVSDSSFLPNGCTLHLDMMTNQLFIERKYHNRQLLDSYDSAISKPISVCVTDGIYDILQIKRNIKLTQNELYNLVELGDIIL